MGRIRGARKRRSSVFREPIIDATPERLAKGDPSVFINPAEIDSSEQPIGLTRQFRASHLDRLYANGKLTDHQWQAGDWYRNTHARCGFSLSVVASYGERTTGGENHYGLARTEAQVRARQQFRMARDQMPKAMVGFMDRFLIHDAMPKYGGRAAMRNLTDIRNALDALSLYLRTC